MRKVLLITLIILLIVGAGFIFVKGFAIGNLEIWGISSIKEKNSEIDSKNSELSNLVSVSYPDSLQQLTTGANTLTATKQEYEEKAVLITNSSSYLQSEKYEIEYLWTRLGNYAKDEKVQIKIDVVNSQTQGLYDLNFTVAGKYVGVTDFIYDIENDSKLGFKIEDFHMISAEGGVQGTFSCKEIGINIENIEKASTEENKDKDSNETNTENANNETNENKSQENETNTTENKTEENTTNNVSQ